LQNHHTQDNNPNHNLKKDTSLRLSTDINHKIVYAKRLIEITKEKHFSKEQVVEFAIDYMLDNHKELYHMNRVIKCNSDKGKINERYERKKNS
jgi:hypothetical protein